MKEKKGIKISIILTLIGVVSLVTGITFAIYENTINAGKSQVIKTGIVNFTLTESTNGLVLDNLQELTDYEGMAQEEYYEFTIKNTGNTITDYEISLVDKPNSSYTGTILNEKYIKVGLLKNNSKEIINRLIDKVTLDVEDTVNYKLRLWLDFGDLEDEAKEALVGQKIFLALKINGIQNVNKIPTGADTLIKLTNNKDNSGLYTITHAKDSTLQIGTNEDITEYRYRGASPKNYVTFNNEVWRILGVFPTDDGTGNIENRIKLIKDQSIGNNYWNTTQVASTSTYNNWTGATLMKYLNGTYYNSLINSNSIDMVDDAKYYLGGFNAVNATIENMYGYERKISGNNTYYYRTNPNSWTGKLGIMYASDYGYASANCETKVLGGNSSTDIRVCNATNWLYNIKVNEWLMAQLGSNNGHAFYVVSSGYLSYYNVNSSSMAVRPTLYLKSEVRITEGDGTSSNPYKLSISKNEDTSGANAPVLASNMIPVYYDATTKAWKKADVKNKAIENRWYNYENHIWANAVTVKEANRQTYLNASVGTPISMDDINTMWVWIPRFNAVTPSNYNGGTQAKPNAIDVTFVKQNETAIDAFTFGDKQLSGFWYGKFEIGGTLASSCTNETCNVSNIVVKPNVSSLRSQKVSSFFFASRSMEQAGNSFGFVSSEVDTHMSKNNEWGAVAYLTQSIYGRCTSSTSCTEVGINNNKSYITGYGAPAGSNDSATNGTYNTSLGKDASTTGTIYGIYDMSGGAGECVMGVLADTNGKPRSGMDSSSNSGFTGMLYEGTTYTGVSFPDSKYYNLYTGSSYTGHALTETKAWYSDTSGSVGTNAPWFIRSGNYFNSMNAGVFFFNSSIGISFSIISSRLVISNE
ncbi:MAG: hypothetical protein BHW63_00420 [Mycoplasma sp. CAG:611_25_7]|nr:MAG: hypothetical protein BHW63_00420 [Mycoplasma sp. CAG:611_25_7]